VGWEFLSLEEVICRFEIVFNLTLGREIWVHEGHEILIEGKGLGRIKGK